MNKDNAKSLEMIASPDPLMRPAPFWSWNDKLDEAELRRQIREMAAKGWGSYFMHSRVGLVTGYLSDEWMNLVKACLDEAEKTDTYAWLYDEDKWPSGFAGGIVPEKDEAYRSRALALLVKGTATDADNVLRSVSYEGIDYDICRRVSPLGDPWFNGTSYIDLMSPQAVRAFLDSTHERYKIACGEHFGKRIPGVFTDEPCYLFFHGYPVPVVPWSDYLPVFFNEFKGYDILDKLPLLFLDIDDFRRVRFDFYDAATELFKRSFTKQYYDWCQENNLILTGHYIIEGSLRDQTQWSGDVMSHYEFMHWPGIDKLGRNVDEITTVKQLTSAADQLSKERALCEVYGCVGQQVSFFHRKWIGDWQAALGIDFINHHLSLYSMRGERKRDCPANLFYQQPWWDDERAFADYQGRLCAAISEGERLVDILMIQPLSSVWCEYSPLHGSAGYTAENTYDVPFAVLSKRLMEEKLDYHYGNENLMAKYGAVENGLLKVGKHGYQCVVIPPSMNLRASTLSLLAEYLKNGGEVIVIGQWPSHIDGQEAEVSLPGAKMAGSIEEAIGLLTARFPDRIQVIDRLTGSNAPAVYVHSRKVGNSVRHLLVNIDDKREVRATVRIPASTDSDLAVFDLFSGDIFKLNADSGSFDVELSPAGSLLVVCGEEASLAAGPCPDVLGSGVVFGDISGSVPSLLIEDVKCEPLEENVFLLNDFSLELDGEIVHEGPVCGAWHKYFYPAAEGTPFKATYTFHSETEVLGCFAAIEVAENLDAISFNGIPVTPKKAPGELGALDPEKSWKDISFTKVPLPEIRRGANVLVIEGRKVNSITCPWSHTRVQDWQNHHATEAEEVYICGRFSVKKLSRGMYAIAPFRNPIGRNLTKEGFPFYCGRILYKTDFTLSEKPEGRVFIGLNGAALASAVIRVNGRECGKLLWEPFMLDISDAVRAGKNELEVETSTTLANAFGPNRCAGIKDEQGIAPQHFIIMERLKRGYELFDFGLESLVIYAP